jgi:hypothetical protein
VVRLVDLADLSLSAETLSLALIVVSLLIMTYLTYRAKTAKSLQFQMFIVLLVIAVAEIPQILNSIGIINLSFIEDFGLAVHTASMVILVAFISFRVSHFFNQGRRK